MDVKLNKYLADVFRNEVGSMPEADSLDSQKDAPKPMTNRQLNPFLVDKKYFLRLDEII
jgi:hypothetical protein